MVLTRGRSRAASCWDALGKLLPGDTRAVKGLTCEKVLNQRTLHVWHKHILENQSGSVVPTMCVPAFQSVSLSPPPFSLVSSSPSLPPPICWFRRLKPKPHKEPQQRPCGASAGHGALAASAPRPPARAHLSCQTFPSMFSPLSFFPRFSAAPVLLCTVRYVRCGSTVPEKTHTTAHAHTRMHTHAVTDTQLGPSCTQRQGFGNQ